MTSGSHSRISWNPVEGFVTPSGSVDAPPPPTDGDLNPSVALLSHHPRSSSLGRRSSYSSTATAPQITTARKAVAVVDPLSCRFQEMLQINGSGSSQMTTQSFVHERHAASTTATSGVTASASVTTAFPLPIRPPTATRIRINVSGQYFDIRLEVLEQHPNTLLGNAEKRRRHYDRRRDEYFLDRHRPSFEAIFAYYMYGGKLKRPGNVPDEIFLAEVLFHELEQRVVDEYKHMEGYSDEEMCLPENRILQFLWKLFEYPKTSRAAFIIALISVSMTLTAIVLLCVETLPIYKGKDCLATGGPNWNSPFFAIEALCNAWFVIELTVRFLACPAKLGFWKDFKNIVDVLSILPFIVALTSMIYAANDYCEHGVDTSAALAFLRVIRLVRIFKLTKHSIGLQVLILTFRASVEGLSMFLVALVVSMLVYSSALYYAELNVTGSQIQSIPDAFWWAIITMTTVGYGDKVPVGPVGRLIGAACAISGILTLAIPVPIIAGHFNKFYTHKTGRIRLQVV